MTIEEVTTSTKPVGRSPICYAPDTYLQQENRDFVDEAIVIVNNYNNHPAGVRVMYVVACKSVDWGSWVEGV
jgi:hypothetical protein